MDTTNSQSDQLTVPWQRTLASIWVMLRSPQTTAALLLVLLLLLLLRLLIPQQSGPLVTVQVWAVTLPAWLQPWSEPLFTAGLSRLGSTLWLWLPLGLLLLNSSLALADFGRLAWQRYKEIPADIDRQHPLASRAEHSIRLTDAPDDQLAQLTTQLEQQGFTLDDPESTEDRVVSAARRRWGWTAVPVFYSGLLLLVAALVLTYASLATEQLTLQPLTQHNSRMFNSAVELYTLDEAGRGVVIFDPLDESQPAKALFLSPYRPALFKSAVIIPTALEPTLTIEAKNSSGERLRLLPAQIDLGPGETLNLSAASDNSPHYFLIPAADLAFQLTPLPGDDGPTRYNVQVRQGTANESSEPFEAVADETFEVDDVSVSLTHTNSLHFIARRDFGLPLLLPALLIIALSAGLLWLRPPWQVWLIADVKGRGGQLYGVAEKFGRPSGLDAFLQQLLTHQAHPTQPTNNPEPAPQADPQSTKDNK